MSTPEDEGRALLREAVEALLSRLRGGTYSPEDLELAEEIIAAHFAHFAGVAGGPEDGHTFEIAVRLRGSYTVVGREGHHDEPEWGPPMVPQQVRARSLDEALEKARQLPLSAWFERGGDDSHHVDELEEAAGRLRAMAEHHRAPIASELRGIAQWMTYVRCTDADEEIARAHRSARALLGEGRA